jgi:hypothetical protein
MAGTLPKGFTCIAQGWRPFGTSYAAGESLGWMQSGSMMDWCDEQAQELKLAKGFHLR